MGLVASTILLLLAASLARVPSSPQGYTAHAITASAGVLQITWLLGREPHLAKVAFPESQALRAAGMFEVQMSDRNEERMHLGSASLRRCAGKTESTDEILFPE